MTFVPRDLPVSDITQVVYEQLPDGIRQKLSVKVSADSYRLVAKAHFKDEQGREFECTLQSTRVSGRDIACVVPEVFIAHLCAVV